MVALALFQDDGIWRHTDDFHHGCGGDDSAFLTVAECCNLQFSLVDSEGRLAAVAFYVEGHDGE